MTFVTRGWFENLRLAQHWETSTASSMVSSDPKLYNDILLIDMSSYVIVFLSVPQMLYPAQETFFEEAAILKRLKTKTGSAA